MRNHKIPKRGINYMLMCVMIASNLAPALIAEAKPEPKATIFEEISAALISQGISNNLDSVKPSNAAAFSGLFFEKTGLGRITFPQPLNLNNSQTQAYLSNLGTALEMSQDTVGLDTSGSAAFAALGASIDIYGLPNIGLSNLSLSVKDSAGKALTEEDIDALVSNESLDCSLGDSACVFSFDTEHFTTFEVDYDATAPIIAQVTPIATPASDTTPSYVFDCDEAGAIVYGGSCGSADLARATAGSNTATFSLVAGTYADCTIKVVDDFGNAGNTLSVPSFTITEPAPSLPNIYEIAPGSNFDAAADSEGNVYTVYERSGNVYIAKNRNAEAFVGAGSSPVIAIGSDNIPQVAYISGSNVVWEKYNGDWEGETIVTGGSAVDIAVDSSNNPHLVFLKNTDSDWYGKLDVAYSYFDNTRFVPLTKIYDGYYWYENGGKSGSYFSYPHVILDENDDYHIVTVQQSVSGAIGWSDSSFSHQYTSNTGNGLSSGISADNYSSFSKNPVVINDFSTAQIVYRGTDGNIYKASASSTWSASSLGAGSSPTIASSGARTAIAYSNSGVRYIEDNGSGFSAATDVDAAGSNPTVVLASGKRFVYYEKNGKIHLATDKTLYVDPVVSGVSEGGAYNTDKTVTWDSGTGSLDGNAFSSGGTVSAEGAHVLVVSNENGSVTVNFTIDKTAPVITIATYDGTTPTNQDITVTASVDEGTLNVNSNTFTTNGSFTFTATDAAGNTATNTVMITNIDKTAPTATVSYDITAPTNMDVVATLNPSEDVTVTSAGGSTHTFTTNGSFTFEFADDAGNTGLAVASVNYIDKTAPIITINPYNSTVVTNGDITVSASTNEGSLNATSHTFTENGSFNFIATDIAGNATTETISITNIDKVGPVITLSSYDGTTPTNQDITVTASTDEGTLNAASHTFSANGSFDFVASDAAGNVTTETVTITNIDKTAPTASISYDITTLTNSDVVATLNPSEAVTVTSEGGQLTHAFATNGDYTFTFNDAAGNTGSALASVDYIDKTAPTITIAPYDGTTPINQDITVTASADEGSLNATSHTFSTNGSFDFIATDAAGNVTIRTITITNIDKDAPAGSVSYDITSATNKNVTAALTASEAVTFTSDGGSTHTFADNGTFTFAFTDAAGNTGSAIATVDYIDRIAPVITLGRYDTTTPTNDDIVVDASADEGTLNAASHIFTQNGSFDFIATDAAGNATTETVTITNIDKVAPTASVSYDITAPTGSDVVATLHPSEEVIVTSEGGNVHTFTANGSFTFEFVDAAGNAGSATASVSNIDKSAKDIASFVFAGLNPQVTGSISGTSIALTVPFGTDVTALVPTIVITGASVSPVSGLAQDFSTPKEYTVTAADGSSGSYTATVSIAPAPSAGFLLPTPSSVSASGSDMRVKAAQQGTLTQSLDENSKIKLHVPRGSVASTTIFEISKGELAEGDKPADHSGAFLFDGMIFNINARDAEGNAVRSFSQDLTITLIVDNLPQDVSGLKLYYFDEAAGRWAIIEDITFSGNTIVFSVNHLTRFALFGTEPTGGEPGRVLGGRTVLLEDGDIIQCKSSGNPNAVYTVRVKNGKTYIRHIVSLEIFNHYRHLRWERLKQVDSLEGYLSSAWVRVNTGASGQAGPQDRVYEINGDQTRHWIDMTAEEFLQHGGSEEAIYSINQGELDLYKEGAAVKLMKY